MVTIKATEGSDFSVVIAGGWMGAHIDLSWDALNSAWLAQKPKTKHFEDTVFEEEMGVNSIAALNRLIEILSGLKTNCLQDVKADPKVRRMMWFLNQQVFGATVNINMLDEWYRLLGEKKREEGQGQ